MVNSINTARNIKKFALKDYSGSGGPVEPVELPTLVGADIF